MRGIFSLLLLTLLLRPEYAFAGNSTVSEILMGVFLMPVVTGLGGWALFRGLRMYVPQRWRESFLIPLEQQHPRKKLARRYFAGLLVLVICFAAAGFQVPSFRIVWLALMLPFIAVASGLQRIGADISDGSLLLLPVSVLFWIPVALVLASVLGRLHGRLRRAGN